MSAMDTPWFTLALSCSRILPLSTEFGRGAPGVRVGRGGAAVVTAAAVVVAAAVADWVAGCPGVPVAGAPVGEAPWPLLGEAVAGGVAVAAFDSVQPRTSSTATRLQAARLAIIVRTESC